MSRISSTAPDGAAIAPLRRTRQTKIQTNELTKPTAHPPTADDDSPIDPQLLEWETTPESEKTAAAVRELDTTEEDIINPDNNNDDQHEDQFAAAEDELTAVEFGPRRASAMSATSRTTAKTSFSQEEMEMMDPDVMLDFLPPLASASEQLARLIAPAGAKTTQTTWKEIKRPGSTTNKLFTGLVAAVNTYKPSFGTSEYIRPDIVLRAVFGVADISQLPEAKWRPDNFIYQVNLAQMLKSILQMSEVADWKRRSDALARLHASLLDTIAGREHSTETLDFYLSLSAQVCITKLAASEQASPGNVSPERVIDSVFIDDEGTFNQIEGLGLDLVNDQRREQCLSMVQQLAEHLKEPFMNETGTTAAIGRLRSRFAWDEFKKHSLRYFQYRATQLKKRIAAAGGVAGIAQSLSKKAREERQSLSKKAREEMQGEGKEMKHGYRADLKALKEKARERSGLKSLGKKSQLEALRQKFSQQPVPMAPMLGTLVTAPDQVVALPDGKGEGQTANVHDGQRVANEEAHRDQQQIRRKWTDPQMGATRIDPYFDLEERQAAAAAARASQAAHTTHAPAPSVLGKRPRGPLEDGIDAFESTQDDASQEEDVFEDGTQDFAAADRRRQELAHTQPKRRRLPDWASGSAVPGPSSSQSVTRGSSPAKRQRKNPGSELPPPSQVPELDDDELPEGSIYARAKVRAKSNRVASTAPRPQQVRKPWTDEEENALIQLIEKHGEEGLSYAALKNIDSQMPPEERRLTRRVAEDLRFKARNMKVTFLLARTGLPANWEHVQLGKKEIDKVKSRGIDYRQHRMRNMPTSNND